MGSGGRTVYGVKSGWSLNESASELAAPSNWLSRGVSVSRLMVFAIDAIDAIDV